MYIPVFLKCYLEIGIFLPEQAFEDRLLEVYDEMHAFGRAPLWGKKKGNCWFAPMEILLSGTDPNR